ncbi:MAG: M20 family metallopeptidase [Candidatus Heimdallarchaeota archaeon]
MNLLLEAKNLLNKVIQIRRQIHMHPEPGFEEVKTAGLITDYLDILGIPYRDGIAETGIVAQLGTDPSKPTIALRADIDALELQEETGAAYASKNPGYMHACGHDAHAAMLIGVAEILSQKELEGNVKLIFQSAEESVMTPDYVGGGAQRMVEAGVMDNVDAILALHVFTELPEGTVGTITGWADLVSASADLFDIQVRGKGGHAAMSHKGKDAIVMAAECVTALQQISSRMVDPIEPVVVSIGTIKGGSRRNIICDHVSMEGTARTLSEEVREMIPQAMERILNGVAGMYESTIDLNYHAIYPIGRNDHQFSQFVHAIAKEVVGPANFTLREKPMMGSEDFWYYGAKAPACFLGIGAGNEEKGLVHINHHPKFDIDEGCMAIGMSVLARTAMEFLSARSAKETTVDE